MKKYTDYNLWANRRMIAMLSPLSETQIAQDIISSFPSVKMTLLHIWDAEVIWLKRLQGESLDYWPSYNFEGKKADIVLNGHVDVVPPSEEGQFDPYIE